MSEYGAILTRLTDADMGVLREAAFDAGEAGIDAAVPRLAELLGTGNIGVQEAAEDALRKIGGSTTVAAMVPLLGSDEAPVRNLAMDILRQVGRQDLDSLIRILHDDDPDLRIFASDILGSSSDEAAVAALGESMLKDPEVNVRYQAAVSLGELGFPSGAAWLNKAMSDDEWVQFAVIEALAKIHDDTSVGALIGALDRSTDLVAAMIVDALGDMGNIKAVGQLLRRLDASPQALQIKIVGAVVKLLGGQSLTLLNQAEQDKFRTHLIAALGDDDPEVQDLAVQGLGFVGGADAAREVLALAGGLDPERDAERIAAAIDMLSSMDPGAALIEVIAEGGNGRARVAMEVAAKLADPTINRAIMDAFWDAERDLQREMAEALLAAAGPEAVEFFRDVLARHSDGTVLKTALAFLGRKQHDDASGESFFGLLAYQYNDVKEAALEACLAVWTPDMATRFQKLIESSDPLDRFMAVYALGHVGDDSCGDVLKAAIGDEVPDVRKAAVESLSNVCSGAELLGLMNTALGDEHPQVRIAVVDTLGRDRSVEAREILYVALEDADDWVRARAMETLAANGDPEAAERIAPLLASDNTLIVLKALDSLCQLGGERAKSAVAGLVEHHDPQVSEAAADSLGRLHARREVM